MEAALALVGEELRQVEQQFRKDLASRVPLIRKVGEYVLASGGKRIRPMLVLLSSKLTGYRGDAHIGLANAVWGNEASVLVGDFLFAKSFSIMVRGGSLAVLQALSDATTMMAEGEV